MSNMLTYKDLQAKLQMLPEQEGSRKVLSVVASNRIPLAGVLLEHNGVMGLGSAAVRKEILVAYAEAGNHMIELVDGELHIWLAGNTLFKIASSAVFDTIIQPENKL